MFKDQNTDMGVEPPSILESRCSALISQCQVPECLRFQHEKIRELRRTRVKNCKNCKSIVNPQTHASCDFASNINQHCLLLGFIRETMLLAGEAGVHSVNRHAQCFQITKRIHQKTVYEKVPQHLWWPKQCEALVSCLNLTTTSPSHQAQHKSSNMHKLLENKAEGHRGSLLGMLPPNGTTPQTAYRNFTQKGAIRAIQDWFDHNDGRLRATHSSTDCNIQQYSNCQKSSSRSKSCHAWKSVECTVACKAPLGHRDSDRLCHQLSLVFPENQTRIKLNAELDHVGPFPILEARCSFLTSHWGTQ